MLPICFHACLLILPCIIHFALDLCTPASDAIYVFAGVLAHLDYMLAKVWSTRIGVAEHLCMHDHCV